MNTDQKKEKKTHLYLKRSRNTRKTSIKRSNAPASKRNNYFSTLHSVQNVSNQNITSMPPSSNTWGSTATHFFFAANTSKQSAAARRASHPPTFITPPSYNHNRIIASSPASYKIIHTTLIISASSLRRRWLINCHSPTESAASALPP